MIEQSFVQRFENNCNGVYYISEQLGRGTDFLSSSDIENNGGIYLMICSIFNSTNTEQIKGRIGRLHNRGQYQYCVCTAESQV